MLGKLIKHEFRATRRSMLPLLILYAAGSALAIVVFYIEALHISRNPLNVSEGWGVFIYIFFGMAMMFFGIMIATAICMNIFVAVNRFHKNLLGDEGYLMHTLPVTAGQKILSKLIVSITWAAVSLAISVLSFAAISGVVNDPSLSSLAGYLRSGILGDHGILYMLMTYAETFFGACKFYLVLFSAMAIGYSVNDNRRIFSVAVGSGIFLAINIIGNFIQAIYNWNQPQLFILGVMFSLNNGGWILELIQLVFSVVTCVILFFVTRYFLEKRLNLQ